MAYSIGTMLSGPGDQTQQQQRHDVSPRKRRLYELIISGFEQLLSQQGRIHADGRGAGYVVWIPRREQYKQQLQQEAWDGEAEGEEGEDESPLVVLYGGGYDGLFSGGLEQALDCCDCLSAPLRLVRIPVELLPPPAHSPPRSSSAKQEASIAALSSSARPLEESAEYNSRGPFSPAPLSSRHKEKEEKKKKKQFGFVGVTPEPDSGWGVSRKRPGPGGVGGGRGGDENCPERGRSGRGGARDDGLGREGGCGWEGCTEGDDDPREEGAAVAAPRNGSVVGEASAGKQFQQREMLDLWWLTDPPAPRVSAEVLRLRVATETVRTLRADTEEAPDVVCTIEVCQGRPYLPGRLQRFPNVATSTGSYRAVHSYRVPPSGYRSSTDGPSPGGGGGASTAGSGGSVFSAPSPGGASSSAWRRGGGEGGAKGMAWVSVTDVKPSHWYNVRHRFSWRVDGSSGLQDVEEVITATRHVHTEAYSPPVTPPPRPYAVLECSRRRHQQQHTQQHTQQGGGRRSSREHTGRRSEEGLVFHFRLRWGPGVRGAGRSEERGFGQGAPQEIEYILQESTCEPRSSTADTASAKKAKASSPASSGGGNGGGEISLGGTSPNNLRSTGERSPKPGATTSQGLKARSSGGNPAAATRNNATWSPGGLGGRGNPAAATADEEDDPFSEKLLAGGGGGPKPARSGSKRHGESGRGEWRTIRRTRKTRETVELPHAPSSPFPSREGGAVPAGLWYRVGARRRDGPLKVVFSEVLEVPAALLARIYGVEEISATRQPLPPPKLASKKRAAGGARPGPLAGEVARRDGARRAVRGLEDEEAVVFLRAFEMSEEEDGFPTRVAWELQSEFWSRQAVEESERPSLADEEKEATLKAEAESIQCTLGFPVNTKNIADIIREIDATARG